MVASLAEWVVAGALPWYRPPGTFLACSPARLPWPDPDLPDAQSAHRPPASSALALPAHAQFGPQGPPAVGAMTASRQPVTESSEFTGRIEAVNRVDIRARVTGFLQERLFQEGQEVKAGDVLFRIERPPFEATAGTGPRQCRLRPGARWRMPGWRWPARGSCSQTGAGTRVALDNAQAQERTANAGLLGAQAQVRTAEINLGYTEIIAPIDGKIGRAALHPGQCGHADPDRAAGDHRQPGPDARGLHRQRPRRRSNCATATSRAAASMPW